MPNNNTNRQWFSDSVKTTQKTINVTKTIYLIWRVNIRFETETKKYLWCQGDISTPLYRQNLKYPGKHGFTMIVMNISYMAKKAEW